MPIVSGLISDVTSRTMITGAWVRATALRPSSTGGLTTDENSPVEMELEGTAARLTMTVEPGPAVLILTMGGEIVESVQLLVPDVDCTLADAWQAAQLATGHTASALEALASQAAASVVEAVNAATEAETSAAEAQWYAENVADDSITTEKIVDGAVTSEKIEDGAVITSKLGPSSVTSEKIASDAVTPAKIEDGAVTGPKIAPAYAQQASTRAVTLIKDGSPKVITAHKVGLVVHLAVSDIEPGTWAATLSTSSATPLRPALMVGDFSATHPGLNDSRVVIVVDGTQFSVRVIGTANYGNIHLTYLSDNSDPLI